MKWFLFNIFMSFSLLAFGHEPSSVGSSVSCEQLLSGQQVAALKAALPFFSVQILHRTADDKTVVLFGEKHKMHADAYNAGVVASSKFPFKGVESYKPNPYLQLQKESENIILQIIKRLVIPKNGDILKDEKTRKEYFYHKEIWGSLITRATFKKELKDQNTNDFTKVFEVWFDGRHSYILWDEATHSLHALEKSEPYENLVIDIEEGHKPNFWEYAYNCSQLMFFDFLFFEFAEISQLVLPDNAHLTLNSLFALFVYKAYLRTGKIFEEKHNYDARLHRYFPVTLGILIGRDQTMSKNIHRTFEKNPDEKLLLAIVGKAHVPGMTQNLIEKHGFKKVELR